MQRSLGWKSPPGRWPAQSLRLLDPIWDCSVTFNHGAAHASGVIPFYSLSKVKERPKHTRHEHPLLWLHWRLQGPLVYCMYSSLYLLLGCSGWRLSQSVFTPLLWDKNFSFLSAEVLTLCVGSHNGCGFLSFRP